MSDNHPHNPDHDTATSKPLNKPATASVVSHAVFTEQQVQGSVQETVQEQIGRKEARRLKAKSQSHQHVWFGLGMFGLIGWSVAIPTLLGAGIGMWIDARWHGRQSWTLMLMFGGLFIGCLNAWRWLRDESEVR